MDPKSFLNLAKDISSEFDNIIKPPDEGLPSPTEKVVYFSLVRGTRGYLEKIVHQINGSYDNGWYDSCAVMIRRLIETLIIECYEAHNIAGKIKDPKGTNGDYLYLKDLILKIQSETDFPNSPSRNIKKSLPKLKDIGNLSAHSRWFMAHRQDIDNIKGDLRIVVQELLSLARLK